jgi:hypothetical protein
MSQKFSDYEMTLHNNLVYCVENCKVGCMATKNMLHVSLQLLFHCISSNKYLESPA